MSTAPTAPIDVLVDATAPLEGAPASADWRPTQLRGLLLAGSLVAAALPLAWSDPAVAAEAFEPDLARLLRGMALLKASFVVAAIGALVWRFAWSIRPSLAALYLSATWAGAAATTMIWQLDQLVLASLLFHVALLTCLLVALRDGRPGRAS